jgi:mRNA interferase RelE/StbE
VRLSFTKHAQKDLAALNASQRDRIIQALDQILINPEHAELRKIKMKPGQWRLRVGDWRIILEIDLIGQVVHVLHIKHRREAYR